MPIHRSKKSHFLQLISRGIDPPTAAHKAKIRHRQTAYAYRQEWLAIQAEQARAAAKAQKQAQEAERQRQEAARAREAEAKAQEIARNSPQAIAARAAAEAEARAKDIRCSTCGQPNPPGCHHSNPTPDPIAEAYALPSPAPPPLTASMGDPFGRTDVPGNPQAYWSQFFADEEEKAAARRWAERGRS